MRRAAGPSKARLAGWSVAWCLALLPLTPWPASLAMQLDSSLGDVSRCSLVWLPWLALIGLPYASRTARRDWGVALGLALPAVTLAAWSDARTGTPLLEVLGGALLGAVLFALLAESARCAAKAELRWYAPTWMALVIGAPTLAAAIDWMSRGELDPSGSSRVLAELSPVSALFLGSGELETWAAVGTQPALFASLTLFVAVAFSARRQEERNA